MCSVFYSVWFYVIAPHSLYLVLRLKIMLTGPQAIQQVQIQTDKLKQQFDGLNKLYTEQHSRNKVISTIFKDIQTILKR